MKHLLLALLLMACAPAAAPQAGEFSRPARVTIAGYDGDAMEPALSRDGRILFFNNRNAPAEHTDIHWAERVDDLTFRYRGLVHGVNTPDALDAVPSISSDNRFCFISTRSYFETRGSVYCGQWDGQGRVTDVALQSTVTGPVLGRLFFDVEIDAGGETLFLADGLFDGGAVPKRADLRIARLRDGAFRLEPEQDPAVAALNTPNVLEYAAAISADGRELSFTRMSGLLPLFPRLEIFIARRRDATAPFGAPRRIEAITGFVEAATFSPDGRALYFHKREGGRYRLWRVTR